MKTCPAAELKRAYPAAHMNLGILLGHAISIHKLGLSELNWLWRPPQAAELLGAACGGLLALISLREIKPSSPGLDPSLQACIPSFSSALPGLVGCPGNGKEAAEASAATEGRVGGAACASQILGGAACASQILVESPSQHDRASIE
jgi:hypothetical protein